MTFELRELLTAPLGALLLPESRLYWPGLVISLLVAAFLLSRQQSRVSWPRRLLPMHLVAHSSTRLDLQLLFLDVARKALTSAPLAIGTTALSITIAQWAQKLWGHPHLNVSPAAVSLSYAVVLLLADDATRYLLHRALHRVPWLMRIHAVHHSAEIMSPLTLKRIHPLEGMLYSLRYAAVSGLVTGLFFYFFRGGLNLETALTGQLFVLSLHYGIANLRHSHIWLSYGSAVEHLLISPAQHQLHHSRERSKQNKNYGSVFALWDLLGRTWSRAGKQRRLRFGLKRGAEKHRTLTAALLVPLLPRRSLRSQATRGQTTVALTNQYREE